MKKSFITSGPDYTIEQGDLKMYNFAYPPGQDSGQPAHPLSLIRVADVLMKNHWYLSYS